MSRWWIDEPVFVGSSNPTKDELEDLFQLGFRTIISLLDENEQPLNYELDEIEKIGFDRVSIPIRDFTAPTQSQFNQFLDDVTRALEKGKVVMHCQGGSGRTGTMGAAYWVSKGLSAKEAIEKVRKSKPNAVENKEQEESLQELKKSLRP
jgi:atypical dual specificity phosphatase